MSESEKYSTTIPNIKDNDGDDVYLKKNIFEKTKNPKIIRVKSFDSKGRYFYQSTLSKNFKNIFYFMSA